MMFNGSSRSSGSLTRALRLLIAQLAGVFLILAVAGWFVVYSTPRVEAATVTKNVTVQRCDIQGKASWYGTESGNRTATGVHFDGSSMTAAMPSRKHLGEHWKVTYKGKSVVVRVNDLGPAKHLHRVIDLSRAAAKRIGLTAAGVGTVCMVRVK